MRTPTKRQRFDTTIPWGIIKPNEKDLIRVPLALYGEIEGDRHMFGLGWGELLIILVIVIAIFGAGRLAGIGGALGSSIREFKKAVKDDETPAVKAEPKAEGETKA